MSNGRFVPTAASFNTERDLKGQKKSLDSRRSSVAETSTRKISQLADEPLSEHTDADEPMTPMPDRRDPQPNMLDSRAPVILTSKPVFSGLYKKRAETDEKD